MQDISENQKITPVMVYTEDALYHGKIITKKIVRTNIFLRTEGAPTYLQLYEAQMIRPGTTIKTKKFDELFVPVNAIICFHAAPNTETELDYDSYEENRRMMPVTVALGSFLFNCTIRISTQTELSASLEVSRMNWLSLYEASISNPYLPKMNVQVPMLIARPEKATFGIIE